MAGYVFKNGAQLLPFRFWVSGYTYLIYGTYLYVWQFATFIFQTAKSKGKAKSSGKIKSKIFKAINIKSENK